MLLPNGRYGRLLRQILWEDVKSLYVIANPQKPITKDAVLTWVRATFPRKGPTLTMSTGASIENYLEDILHEEFLEHLTL